MERSNYFPTQYVVADDLNNTEATKASQSIKRTQAPLGSSGGFMETALYTSSASVKGGVYGSPADYLDSGKNLAVQIGIGGTTIAIAPGTALSPTGELIVVPSALALTLEDDLTHWKWQSASASSGIVYVKLSYIETPSVYKTPDSGSVVATRYSESYYVNVDTTVPDWSTEIPLAKFTADGSGVYVAATLEDWRKYVRTITPANAVIVDPYSKPYAAVTTVEDHIRGIGHGTPTSFNPHGLNATDIGTDFNAPVALHRQDSHINGIMIVGSRSVAALNSLYATVDTDPYYTGALSRLLFVSLSGSTASVNGILYNTFGGYYLPISLAPADGNYYAGVTSASGTIGAFTWQSTSVYTQDQTNPTYRIDFMPICIATISGGKAAVAVDTDVREFCTLSPYDIRADYSNDVFPSASVQTRTSTLHDTLVGMRNAFNGFSTVTIDSSGSYPKNTAFYNGTGKPYFVSIVHSWNSTAYGFIDIGVSTSSSYLDCLAWYVDYFSLDVGRDALPQINTSHAMVPAGYYWAYSWTGGLLSDPEIVRIIITG